jgi:hypothetical protein
LGTDPDGGDVGPGQATEDDPGLARDALELVTVEPGGRGTTLTIAAIVLALIGIVGIGLSPSPDVVADLTPPIEPPRPSIQSPPTRAPSTAPAPTARSLGVGIYDDPCGGPRATIDPGPVVISWLGGRIQFNVPDGWRWWAGGGMIFRYNPCGPSPTLVLQVADIVHIPVNVCSTSPSKKWVKVRPTIQGLEAAMVSLSGQPGSRGTEVTLAGRVATRFDLDVARCSDGPEGRIMWRGPGGTGFGALRDGSATVYVVDVDGTPLTIAISERGATTNDLAELGAILGSMRIE